MILVAGDEPILIGTGFFFDSIIDHQGPFPGFLPADGGFSQ
jgi:hypothetical protein